MLSGEEGGPHRTKAGERETEVGEQGVLGCLFRPTISKRRLNTTPPLRNTPYNLFKMGHCLGRKKRVVSPETTKDNL